MLFFSSISGYAQTYNHTSVWSRFLISKQVGKFILTGDGAYRRQNNFHYSKLNFLQNPFSIVCELTLPCGHCFKLFGGNFNLPKIRKSCSDVQCNGNFKKTL